MPNLFAVKHMISSITVYRSANQTKISRLQDGSPLVQRAVDSGRVDALTTACLGPVHRQQRDQGERARARSLDPAESFPQPVVSQ